MNLDYFSTDTENVFFRCVEDCNEAVMISDKDGILRYVNPHWEKIYGYTKEEAIGQSPKILNSGKQNESFYDDMWKDILDPEIGSWKGELVNKAKNGTLIPVFLTITPFHNISGETVGYMGIAVDIRKNKQLEAEIRRQDRLASIGILTSGLAHEVGTPMGVIRGRAEFLKLQNGHNEHLKKNLKIIIDQIDRISKLISSLLRFSRSSDDIKIKSVDFAKIVEEVLLLVEEKMRKRSIDVRVEIPNNLEVLGDTGRVQQILINLLINALHAIEKEIKEGRKDNHFISINSMETKTGIEVRIQDSGCGIPPENLKKIFEPFFTTKDIGEGTGLGLAIVSKIADEMKASIHAESTVGQGTTFCLTFRRP